MGLLEFLLGAEESADAAPPDVDAAFVLMAKEDYGEILDISNRFGVLEIIRERSSLLASVFLFYFSKEEEEEEKERERYLRWPAGGEPERASKRESNQTNRKLLV